MNTTRTFPSLVFLAAAAALALAPATRASEADTARKQETTVTVTAGGGHLLTITTHEKGAAHGKKANGAKADDAKPAADPESGAGAGSKPADEEDTGWDSGDDSLIRVGSDATLEAGRKADAVVSVFGNASSAGDVQDAVVAVLGNVRSTGTVGEAVVSVLGDAYVDGPAGGVVALGNAELGPHAIIKGDVVVLGGELKRDPAAVVHGSVQEVGFLGAGGASRVATGLRAWISHCLLLGRPLAFGPDLGWAWTIAGFYLAIYLLTVLLFPQAVHHCVGVMEQRPGRSLLASVLSVPLKWIALVLLVITGIGILALPFALLAIKLASVLGKAVAFAWIGRRLLPHAPDDRRPGPLLLATLVGAVLVTAFYVVPFVGFIAYKAVAVLGFGIVAYALVLRMFPERPAGRPASAAAGPGPGAASSQEQAQAQAAPAAEAAAATPPPAPATPAPPADVAALPRAGFWLRMGALAIDGFIVAIVWHVLPFTGEHSMLVALAAYGAVLWKLRGTTVGGTVCRLSVRRLDGRPIDWPTAVVRALGCFLSLLVAGLGFLWIAFDDEKQAWHDKIAGTVVVREPQGRPLL